MAEAKRDGNFVPTLLGVSSSDGTTPVTIYADPTTHRLYVDLPGGAGAGTVTSVSVVTANGVSGSVATATSTPAITLTLGAITPTSVNGLTITTSTGTLTITNGKTLTVSNTLTLTATDGSTLAIGTGGTLGSAAYTASTAYATPALDNLASVAINAALTLGTSDAAALGSPTKMWSDLFLASGAVINFNNGDVTLTHGADSLVLAGGVLTVPANGLTINATNVTATGTQLNYLNAATGTTGTTSTNVVFSTSPALTTPNIGAATATSVNGLTITSSTGTLTITNGKTVSVTNTLTLSGTDGTTMTFPSTSASIARTDAANTFTGASTASAWVLTAPTITTSIVPTSDDGAALGDATHNFSDLFLASGALIKFASTNVVITHSSGVLTMGTGDLRITTAGTDSASVVTVGGTQTLTNKTLTSPTLTTPSAFTTGGVITLAENTSIAYDPAGSADGKYTGLTIAGTAGEALAFGDVIVLDVTAGKWFKGSVSAAAGADGDLRGGTGMCVLAAAGDASATTVLLHGTCRADANFPALTIGSVVYATTSGDITVTRPSTTDHIIKVLGFALTADEILFNPSMDYITNV